MPYVPLKSLDHSIKVMFILKINQIGSNFWVDFGYDIYEFFVADHSVSVLVSEVDHLINLGTWKALSNASSHFLEFLWAKWSASSCIECLENYLESSLVVGISAEAENLEESWKINISLMAACVDDVKDLSSLGLEVQGSDSAD